MSLKARFQQLILTRFPGLREELREELISDQLLSPFQISLSAMTLEKIQQAVSAFFELRQRLSQSPSATAKEELQRRGLKDPGNFSVMMSYDFHLTEEGQPKLIEINTNAAFLVLSLPLYEAHGLPLPVSGFDEADLKACFENELRLNGQHTTSPRMAIVDEAPEQQRLFLEFLLLREWSRQWGWTTEIRDLSEALKEPRPQLIYNRWTDFYLEQEKSKELRTAFLNREVCLSPNPWEYFWLADKQRLIEWSQPGALDSSGLAPNQLETLLSTLPRCQDLNPEQAERLWAERKKLFFKPKREFGSKKAFKGASISRKMFDELLQQDLMAQEYIPAPEIRFETPDGPQNFKWDLRVYAYKGRVQNLIARLYQGQVTNLKTPYGGFAPVVIQ